MLKLFKAFIRGYREVKEIEMREYGVWKEHKKPN